MCGGCCTGGHSDTCLKGCPELMAEIVASFGLTCARILGILTLNCHTEGCFVCMSVPAERPLIQEVKFLNSHLLFSPFIRALRVFNARFKGYEQTVHCTVSLTKVTVEVCSTRLLGKQENDVKSRLSPGVAMVHPARSFGQCRGQFDFERVRSCFECSESAVVAR